MFPNEDDARLFAAARSRRPGPPAWESFTTLSEVADDLVAQMRAQYRNGQPRFIVSSRCTIAKLTDLPSRVMRETMGVPLPRRTLADQIRFCTKLDSLMSRLLADRIDTTKIDPIVYKSNCDGGEQYSLHLDYWMRAVGLSDVSVLDDELLPVDPRAH